MATLEEKQIETDLKDIENRIGINKKFTRSDIADILNRIYGKKYSPDKKKEIIKNLIKRTGVKIKGIKTLYTPDEELSLVDKTFDFLNDLYSYDNFIEEEH